MAADKLALLARGLEDAVVALRGELTDDAARQHVWSLLGSNTQFVLGALYAAATAPAISKLPSKPAASRPRTARGLARFPEDVLGAILAFVALPMRFTCVAACSTLRDACARLSPRLEHSLVAKRFPLINTFGSASALEQHEQFVRAIDAQLGESDTAALSNRTLPAPRDLFRTFKDFEGENTYVVRPETSIALDAYTLSLEIKARKLSPRAGGPGWQFNGTQESICVSTGELQSETAPRVVYKFTIPEAAYERVRQLDAPASHWRLLTTVVASRRGPSGRLQFAKLHHEDCQVTSQGDQFWFDNTEIPLVAGNQALNFIKWRADNSDMYTDPVLELDSMGPSAVEAIFKWISPHDSEDMSQHDARCCLEHYAAWSD